MKLLSDAALQQRAIAATDELVTLLVRGRTTYDVCSSSIEHAPMSHRHVFRQKMVVWRDFDQVEIVVDEETRAIRSFKDNKRLEAKTERPLSAADLLRIARTSGLVAEVARVDQVKPGKLYRCVITQSAPGLPGRIHFTINSAKRQVAAFEVQG
jgi:hypothetical protein